MVSIAGSILVALTTATALVFLVYICQLSRRRQAWPSPVGRRLAEGNGRQVGEDQSDTSDFCSVGENTAETSPESYHSGVLSDEGTEAAAFGTEGVIPAPVGPSAPQAVHVEGEGEAKKRPADDEDGGSPDAKCAKEEHWTLLEPPEPLSESINSVIDSMVAAEEDGLSVDEWIDIALGGALDAATPEDTLWESLDGLQTSPPGSPSLPSVDFETLSAHTASKPGVSSSSSVSSPVTPTATSTTPADSSLSETEDSLLETEGPISSSTDSELSTVSPASPAVPGVVHSSIGKQAEGVTEPTDSDEQMPTTSTAGVSVTSEGPLLPGGSPSSGSLSEHPFYWLPVGTQGGSMRLRYSERRGLAAIREQFTQVSQLLQSLASLLKRPSLTGKQTKDMLFLAEKLVAYVTTDMALHHRRWGPAKKAELLGLLFLVVDALYCAAEVLGESSGKQIWWPKLMDVVATAKHNVGQSSLPAQGLSQIEELILLLISALDTYSNNQRPSAEVVVALKRQLLYAETGIPDRESGQQQQLQRKLYERKRQPTEC
ncbi:hypothetical protein cyc_02155 [Cyclospora cayetanensis]|uniref:Uncharacterized protein n=1 Tax=Cyclospora cayetanensis TaxID=88456 RepID=A0A1D3D9T4_9EIME|nr:hypothetical protein cyc_02155 [Cyclospora cayetanensis]